ncbi:uncharacterized protein K02A2.6-like [Ornithodoros turicata]|uniref:uncharacterized protein K02A2.6-like n=1 Tax=Ornithodoros turicata TaxID=34597 RepID=UPI00313A1AB2
MTPTELRYSQTEKEALATAWAIQRFDEFIRGIAFTVETDHLPLVSLFGKMELDILPPRVQRLRLKTMCYEFQMLYVPGKLLATADTLSRCPPAPHVDAVELFAVEMVAATPEVLPVNLQAVRNAQVCDGECSTLVSFCEHGWPHKSKLPVHVTKYLSVKDELSICDGLLLKGTRLVIPASLRAAVLCLLHDGHQGINRTKSLARESVWWPGISAEINSLVTNCEKCAGTRQNPAQPLMSTDLPSRPWEVLGLDLFHLNGQEFVMVVDYYSRYPEVMTLRSTTAQIVIGVRKSLFARHGIPQQVRSDNGPPFSSRDFAAFALSYGFDHVTSSPHYAQSNGEVERMIRTVKDLLRKAKDPHLALLNYRDTSGVTGFSPAQLLMGRRLRTRVPKTENQLRAQWPKREEVAGRDEPYKWKKAQDFNRHHQARELPPLRTGQQVWVRPEQVRATVLSPAQRPRSFVVETERDAILQRNRRHLVPFLRKLPALPVLQPPVSTNSAPGTGTPVLQHGERDCAVYTRSGRRVIPSDRLNL